MATSAIQTLRPDRASVYRALMKLVNLINQCRLAFTPTHGTLRQAFAASLWLAMRLECCPISGPQKFPNSMSQCAR
jgi:hypothetical protein